MLCKGHLADHVELKKKYFDIPEIAKLSNTLSGKSFSLFHVNTRSFSKNFDQLLSVLSSLKVNFNLIGITETKQQIGKDFLVNVDVNDFFMYTQPSKLASGGVAIYVKDNLDHSRIDNMCITNNEFEVLWIEIKNRKGKNFLCGCAYRHPNTDCNNFLEYLEKTFAKINKNKYDIFLMGDFNIDLLQDLGQNLANAMVYSMAYLWRTLWPTCGLPFIL